MSYQTKYTKQITECKTKIADIEQQLKDTETLRNSAKNRAHKGELQKTQEDLGTNLKELCDRYELKKEYENLKVLEANQKCTNPSLMDNYKRCNTKPICRLIGKKSLYTVCGIPLVYGESFYMKWTYSEMQNVCGSYLQKDLKHYLGVKCYVDELIEGMIADGKCEWEYSHKYVDNHYEPDYDETFKQTCYKTLVYTHKMKFLGSWGHGKVYMEDYDER